MRLKVGLIDSDTIYAERFLNSIQLKYAGEFDMHVYTNLGDAYQGIQNIYFDVILLAEDMSFDLNVLPKGVAVVILSPKDNVTGIDGHAAVSKFHQKTSEIYKEIMAAYAESAKTDNTQKKQHDTMVTLFTSAQGGAGTSTVGAAYALIKAKEGRNVLFLQLDLFGDISLYFSGDGKRSFTDVINGIKKNVNIEATVKAALKTDTSGVKFFDTCKNAFDMVELRDEELWTLLNKLLEEPFDDIVISYSSELNERLILLMTKYAKQTIYINSGSSIGNIKFLQLCEALGVIEQKREMHILNKMRLLYNNFSSKTGVQLENTAVPVIGGIQRILTPDNKQLMMEIANKESINW